VPAGAPPLEIAREHLQRTRGRFGLTEDDLVDVVIQEMDH
jgi:hypothetical protein